MLALRFCYFLNGGAATGFLDGAGCAVEETLLWILILGCAVRVQTTVFPTFFPIEASS